MISQTLSLSLSDHPQLVVWFSLTFGKLLSQTGLFNYIHTGCDVPEVKFPAANLDSIPSYRY